jgi:SAM-dependent methyltransferase
MTAIEHWAAALQQWGIPEHILDAAPQSPWIHPVANFRPTGNLYVNTPSRLRALEALDGPEPSVLDVGCGGGRAGFGLTPPATRVFGVDQQQAMLDVFTEEANARGVGVGTALGNWPEVAAQAPACDVVTCHHVFYNVQQLVPFASALTEHATRRVVIEMPMQHPLSTLSAAWLHFWDLRRPTSPTAVDALAVLHEMGLSAHLEEFEVPAPQPPAPVTDLDVEHTRIRLCLPAHRDPEVREFLLANPPGPRHTATLWWDR